MTLLRPGSSETSAEAAQESGQETGPETGPETGSATGQEAGVAREAETGPEDPSAAAAPPDVVAAGVVCWRRAREGGGLEVLLVHRTASDDWSWPRGTPERREGLAECAVREAAEEAGVQVVLGRPLPSARHRRPDGRLEETSYWAARVTGSGRPSAPAPEIDRVAWFPAEAAARQLPRSADAVPLATLVDFADSGTLATAACLVVRHATARPRDAWARADGERPLVASGKRQAMALAALLQCWRPDYVMCSSWRRCIQTMTPYAAASGVRLRAKGGLTEDGYRRSPGKVRRHTHHLLENAHGGVLCTHRPVLEGVIAALRERSTAAVVRELPDTNPFLHPGEVLVAHVAPRPGGKPQVVAMERHGTR